MMDNNWGVFVYNGKKRLFPLSIVAATLVVVGLGPVGAYADEPAAVTESEAEVTSIVENADGTITETIYAPAPGVSAAELALSLRASGVPATVNDVSATATAQKWQTACHELGHVLGLFHNTSTSSCLYNARTSQETPNADDYALLESYY
jgi:hypothetical protein